ncbi:hypothetical protein ACLMJK_000340 [Lecanora helva]
MAANTASSIAAPFRFLKLPREVRDNIYKYCIDDSGDTPLQRFESTIVLRQGIVNTSIFHLNRRVYAESLKIIYQTTVFVIENLEGQQQSSIPLDLRRFASLPGFRYIRHIRLTVESNWCLFQGLDMKLNWALTICLQRHSLIWIANLLKSVRDLRSLGITWVDNYESLEYDAKAGFLEPVCNLALPCRIYDVRLKPSLRAPSNDFPEKAKKQLQRRLDKLRRDNRTNGKPTYTAHIDDSSPLSAVNAFSRALSQKKGC